MSAPLIVRAGLTVDDRSFLVLGEPWYDADDAEWKGRLTFVPLDRSLPRSVPTGPLRRSRRRDELVAWLAGLGDDDIARALRTIAPRPRP